MSTEDTTTDELSLLEDPIIREGERVAKALSERLEAYDGNRKEVQEKLHAICDRVRKQVDELEERINKELEEKYVAEDNRLQTALHKLREASRKEDEQNSELKKAIQSGKAKLIVSQSHKLFGLKKRNRNHKTFDADEIENYDINFSTMFELTTEKNTVPEWADINEPENLVSLRLSLAEFISALQGIQNRKMS